jgi:5-methylcytosine-specific restriction endonuclease McrA
LRELRHAELQKRGGCCSRCGYSEYETALHFHHVGEKEYSVSSLFSRHANYPTDSSYGRLQAELDKCIVLCANCHAGLHNGY